MNRRKQSGFTLIEIMIVVGIIGLLAAVAIPCYQKSVETAQKRACQLNRRNIDGAKLQWAMEHQQPPEATPQDEDLFGEEKYIEHKPDCPARGLYSLREVREKCTCSFPKHGD